MVLSGGLPYNARLLYAVREFVQRLSPVRWTVSKRRAQLELMDILARPEENHLQRDGSSGAEHGRRNQSRAGAARASRE